MTWLSRIFNIRRAKEPDYISTSRIPWERVAAGVRVDADTAVTVPAVWACLRYLSQTVAVLPWHVMRDGEGGAEKATSHPVDWLLWKRPNPEWSSFQFRETLTHWALRHGNGYAEIERDGMGRPIALWPLHPQRVVPMRPSEGGALFYRVDGLNDLSLMDVFHVRGFGEGPVGLSVVEYAAQSIGWAKAAQMFGAGFFGNGMNIGGYIEVPGGLRPEGKAELDKELKRKLGGPKKAGSFPILDAGMKVVPLGIEPNKGQFIETNQFLVSEICRWFGVPPHKVADLMRATFSNIEHQSIEVVQDSIMPWVKRFEDEADYKLFGAQNRNGYYTRINITGLLRGDTAARAAMYKMMFETGSFSPNMILGLEDMPKIPASEGGDKHLVQLALTTLERVGEEVAQPPAVEPPAPEPNEDEMAAQDRIGRLLNQMEPVHAV
jgi:HK97 family phage portal protein